MSSDDLTEGDRNFDDMAARFARTIYDTPRGRLRLAALQKDFCDNELALNDARVLDVGGGQGQFSVWLAQKGAHIDLLDSSESMLALARDNFHQHDLNVNLIHQPLQSLDDDDTTYDIVLNHAVLEWLAEPFSALALLPSKVKSGGYLSLLIYNQHGHQWRQLVNGRIHDVLGATSRLKAEGNAPKHAFDPDDIVTRMTASGLQLIAKRGVRCLYDHMHPKARNCYTDEEIIEADLFWGTQMPYQQLGRYVHLLLQRTD